MGRCRLSFFGCLLSLEWKTLQHILHIFIYLLFHFYPKHFLWRLPTDSQEIFLHDVALAPLDAVLCWFLQTALRDLNDGKTNLPPFVIIHNCLHCFDVDGWAAKMVSGLYKLSGEVLAWLSVWSVVQMICIWSSWCHCHPTISCFVKIQNGLPFWCHLTQVILENGR